MDRVGRVMKKVKDCVSVGASLDVPRSKRHATREYWLQTLPDASWERLAGVLYYWEEERALKAVKEYLQSPQGKLWNGISYSQWELTDINSLVLIRVGILLHCNNEWVISTH